ncbi:hypothetical protein EsH8_IV_001397 [Colletotrichum jinshuiense]
MRVDETLCPKFHTQLLRRAAMDTTALRNSGMVRREVLTLLQERTDARRNGGSTTNTYATTPASAADASATDANQIGPSTNLTVNVEFGSDPSHGEQQNNEACEGAHERPASVEEGGVALAHPTPRRTPQPAFALSNASPQRNLNGDWRSRQPSRPPTLSLRKVLAVSDPEPTPPTLLERLAPTEPDSAPEEMVPWSRDERNPSRHRYLTEDERKQHGLFQVLARARADGRRRRDEEDSEQSEEPIPLFTRTPKGECLTEPQARHAVSPRAASLLEIFRKAKGQAASPEEKSNGRHDLDGGEGGNYTWRAEDEGRHVRQAVEGPVEPGDVDVKGRDLCNLVQFGDMAAVEIRRRWG